MSRLAARCDRTSVLPSESAVADPTDLIGTNGPVRRYVVRRRAAMWFAQATQRRRAKNARGWRGAGAVQPDWQIGTLAANARGPVSATGAGAAYPLVPSRHNQSTAKIGSSVLLVPSSAIEDLTAAGIHGEPVHRPSVRASADDRVAVRAARQRQDGGSGARDHRGYAFATQSLTRAADAGMAPAR